MSWHVDPDALTRYLGGIAVPAEAMSIEAHVVGCVTCRTAIAVRGDEARLARTWSAVVDEVDRPHSTPLERLLARLGVPDSHAHLLVSAPSMRLPWVLATMAALAFAIVAAALSASTVTLAAMLLVAPVGPVAGVALSYGAGVDAIHELTKSTPINKFDLLLLRAAAVLGVASLLSVAAAAFLPDAGWTVAAWLLPATALTAVAIALATWFSTRSAATIACSAWIVSVFVGLRSAGRGTRLDELVVNQLVLFRPAGQLVLALIAAAALVIAYERRDAFDAGRAV